MRRESWKKAKEIFHAALEHEAHERTAFLDRACAGDSSLRSEVASLLGADAGEPSWLDRAVFESAAGLLTGNPEARRRIGPYELIREIGRGGMGTVYLAERADDEFQQQVAVKLLKRGMDSEDILRRFRQERQILASLDHPWIARLLDGGMASDGVPYFIMEYIDGVPIDTYCDRQALPLGARLELFRSVLTAVLYAHRHLIVHCDLKPSNILVTAEGMPKLLDFGIAKLLGSSSPGRQATTAAAARLMTPEYASPEQARGERITTASDVYSLGILLFKLLTGVHPFHLEDASPGEVERIICEAEPANPSAVTRGLPEDLDSIVRMAMRKDPGRRYGSVEQLSEDLRRHAECLPILACKDTWAYRSRKFIRRHRVGVAATFLVVLSLLAGILATTWQAGEAQAQREKARVQQAAAEQVADFLARLLQEADPYGERSDAVTVREVLDEGAEQIESELRDQPEVQARMMNTIGVAYRNLGLYDRALPLFEKALRTRQRLLSPRSPEVIESLGSLGSLLQAKGDYVGAERVLREVLATRRALGEETLELAESTNNLAVLLRAMGEYEATEPLYREALALYRRLLGEQSVEVATSLHNLGGLLRLRGDYEAAEAHLRKSVELFREILGEDHPHVATSLNSLAVLLKSRGDYDAALEAYREVLAVQRKSLGNEHPAVARTLSNLGALFSSRGDGAAAAELLQASAEMYRRLLGESHPELANPLHHLGHLYRTEGKLAAAEPFLRQALKLRREALGPRHPSVAISLLALGQLLMDRGQAARAEEMLREGLAIREEKLEPGHWRTANARSLLGECLCALDRFEEAEPLLLDSYRILTKTRADDDRLVEASRRRLAVLYEAWGRPAVAAEYREPSRAGRTP